MAALPVRDFDLHAGVPGDFPGRVIGAALEGEGGLEEAGEGQKLSGEPPQRPIRFHRLSGPPAKPPRARRSRGWRRRVRARGPALRSAARCDRFRGTPPSRFPGAAPIVDAQGVGEHGASRKGERCDGRRLLPQHRRSRPERALARNGPRNRDSMCLGQRGFRIASSAGWRISREGSDPRKPTRCSRHWVERRSIRGGSAGSALTPWKPLVKT